MPILVSANYDSWAEIDRRLMAALRTVEATKDQPRKSVHAREVWYALADVAALYIQERLGKDGMYHHLVTAADVMLFYETFASDVQKRHAQTCVPCFSTLVTVMKLR